MTSRSSRRRRASPAVAAADQPDGEYRVGPGRPPRQFQFKPGQSGNPRGARRKPESLALDLKHLLERALSEKTRLRVGEREQIVSKAAAGIHRLVTQFVKGNWHARRDLIALADKLGVDLTAGEGKAIEKAFADVVDADDDALLADYVRRHSRQGDDRSSEPDNSPQTPERNRGPAGSAEEPS